MARSEVPCVRWRWLNAMVISVLEMSCAIAAAQELALPLHTGWRFTYGEDSLLLPATVPGTIHQDLLAHGLIPDPYVGRNIDSVQWVEEEDWRYECLFTPSAEMLGKEHIDLLFKGLDTFCEVQLNDGPVWRTDNMFRSWSFEVKQLLHSGINRLTVRLRSPMTRGRSLRESYGVQLPADNDASSEKVSPYIRKASYQFGWDFCPRLVTSGIWQPVQLVGWDDARISEVRFRQVFAGSGVVLGAEVRVEGAPEGLSVGFEVDGARTIVPVVAGQGGGSAKASISIPDPRLWWPNGAGDQVLYPVQVDLIRRGTIISRTERRIGLRNVELDQRKDSIGSAFQFIVNGVPTFMKGCNMVPPDMLLPRAADTVWVRLVRDMQRAHMNMVRVWAGGVYPPDAFFDACDSAGILVWQDLQFANWVPWDDPGFRNNALAEVSEQIKRLRHHASIALFCGNNELDVAWKNWGWQSTYALGEADQERLLRSYAQCFRSDLPDRVAALSDIPYVSTSPLSNWGNAEGLRNGSLHYWEVWHGDGAFDQFADNVGRFVSEYGFQSYPDSALLAKYLSADQLALGSSTLLARQRSYRGDAPIWSAIQRETGETPTTLNGFIEASQQVQAKAYREAIWAHRTGRPHCMGTLFWQLNDCWPGPSWSAVDIAGHWKPVLHEVQRMYAPLIMGSRETPSGTVIEVLNEGPAVTGTIVGVLPGGAMVELVRDHFFEPGRTRVGPVLSADSDRYSPVPAIGFRLLDGQGKDLATAPR